ncbi:hypothetical protein Cci01nite_52170 [Catellatospora citrea]|uniref:Uncharacterized protein n=1 Tax=Catellatospora citrea TaxID=53366 RepID=A0A8J3P129_9ACTN|nr:hypothetical protein Cci01nite_52170 [Catellatospora citrea]
MPRQPAGGRLLDAYITVAPQARRGGRHAARLPHVVTLGSAPPVGRRDPKSDSVSHVHIVRRDLDNL